ncbi:hypothetical protein GJR88_03539 [Dietzia sp. DQ12-45-1b]|nr:hypothetical protein GJR88_03539 [Dietzia sp. DQ12-45-1b]
MLRRPSPSSSQGTSVRGRAPNPRVRRRGRRARAKTVVTRVGDRSRGSVRRGAPRARRGSGG